MQTFWEHILILEAISGTCDIPRVNLDDVACWDLMVYSHTSTYMCINVKNYRPWITRITFELCSGISNLGFKNISSLPISLSKMLTVLHSTFTHNGQLLLGLNTYYLRQGGRKVSFIF